MVIKASHFIISAVVFSTVALCAPIDTARLEGDWVGGFVANGYARSYVVVIRAAGDSFGGFVQKTSGGRKFAITKPTLDGDDFTFVVDRMRITGKILPEGALLARVPFGRNEPPSMVTLKKSPGFAAGIARQVAGVDQTPMGVYRSLADISIEAVRRNDLEQAMRFAYLLARVWDAESEELRKNNGQQWQEIDAALDEFTSPIMSYKYAPLDSAKTAQAHQKLTERLKAAEK